MMNYILADYKRVMTRIPRIVLVAVFEIIFLVYILFSWNKAHGSFNSVKLLENANTFFETFFLLLIATSDFIHSFSYDFKSKTIQVAIGLGISRLKVIICKLIQTTLVILTDMIITFGVFAILCAITGIPLAAHQVFTVCATGLYTVLLSSCTICIIMFLVFRFQNMLISMLSYFVLSLGLCSALLRSLSRSGPVFLARLQLERFTHDSFIGLIRTNALIGRFQLYPYLGAAAFFALGICLCWLAFRKQELDF